MKTTICYQFFDWRHAGRPMLYVTSESPPSVGDNIVHPDGSNWRVDARRFEIAAEAAEGKQVYRHHIDIYCVPS